MASSTTTLQEEAKALQPRYRTDKYIWGIYFILCFYSIVELYSASSREVTAGSVYAPLLRHMLHLGIGLAVMLGVQRLQLKTIYKYTLPFVILSMAMMVYVMLAGQVVNGARRSFSIGITSVFPAEFLKISAVLIIAYVLCKCQRKNGVADWGLIVCAVLVAVFSLLLFSQGLTNTLLLMAISLAMMLIGGVGWKRFLLVLACYGVLGMGGMALKSALSSDKDDNPDRSSTWSARIDRFRKPDKYNDPITAENRQEQFSYIAQANGGVTGVMPGNSRETARLPLAFSDYIFAIVVEDMGFVGGVLLIFFYLSLLGRASALAWGCKRVYPALLVMGMATFICLQALFHMAIVTGVFPVSGQPLPLISKGGTSIIVTSLALGVMLSVSRHALRSGNREATAETMSDLPEALKAPNPSGSQK